MLLNNLVGQTKSLITFIIFLFIITSVSIISNILLASSVYYLKTKQDIIILPFDHSEKYLFNNDKLDSRYLQNMGLSFISLRLNVTPETVQKQHKLLLSYVDSTVRPEIADILTDEADVIITGNISSAFYYDEINIYPEYSVFEIRGVLKTWSGNRALTNSPKVYQLKVEFVNGQLIIKNFIEVSPE